MSSCLATASTYAYGRPVTSARPHVKFRVIEGGKAACGERCAEQLTWMTPLVAGLVLMLLVGFAWRTSDICSQRRVQDALSSADYQIVTVHPGDTIWDIAERHPVEGCTTEQLVYHIRSINSLDNANLSVGMDLCIPQAS